jgi:hypothetical protein
MAAGQIAEPRLTRLRVSFTRSYQRANVHLRNGCAEFDRTDGGLASGGQVRLGVWQGWVRTAQDRTNGSTHETRNLMAPNSGAKHTRG